jgi:hypothetical protein
MLNSKPGAAKAPAGAPAGGLASADQAKDDESEEEASGEGAAPKKEEPLEIDVDQLASQAFLPPKNASAQSYSQSGAHARNELPRVLLGECVPDLRRQAPWRSRPRVR